MSEGLSIDEVDAPQVSASDDVVVEVEGAGWCQTDNHIIEGMWAEYVPQPLPMTLGHENAGTVVATGDEVTLVSEGDQVICHPVQTCGTCRPCRQGETMYCENDAFNGLTTDGGFADQLHTAERSVIPLPDGVEPADIAPHADAGITAYHAAKKAVSGLAPGDTAVVIGIGGLGHIGLQCLDAMSAAEIVAVDIKQSARDLASDLGAGYTLDPESEDIAAEVGQITDDRAGARHHRRGRRPPHHRLRRAHPRTGAGAGQRRVLLRRQHRRALRRASGTRRARRPGRGRAPHQPLRPRTGQRGRREARTPRNRRPRGHHAVSPADRPSQNGNSDSAAGSRSSNSISWPSWSFVNAYRSSHDAGSR